MCLSISLCFFYLHFSSRSAMCSVFCHMFLDPKVKTDLPCFSLWNFPSHPFAWSNNCFGLKLCLLYKYYELNHSALQLVVCCKKQPHCWRSELCFLSEGTGCSGLPVLQERTLRYKMYFSWEVLTHCEQAISLSFLIKLTIAISLNMILLGLFSSP